MDTTFAWMIGGGFSAADREPNPRTLSHLMALRDAQREATGETSPIARLAAWFGNQPVRASAESISLCCTPA